MMSNKMHNYSIRGQCIVRPGENRRERVETRSKTAYSVVFSGSATGIFLPPMVVYKAKNMYEARASHAIPGVVY